MAKRNTSASNVAERPVVSGAKSANVPGALGHALAAIIIAEAMKVGELLEKTALSRKDKLAKLVALDKDGRKEFLADMLAKQEEINTDAKAVPNRSLRDYMEDHPKMGSVYAETSMWIGMVRAVDLGWSPQDAKGEVLSDPKAWPEWRLLTMQASKARDAKGKPSANGKNPELVPSARKRGRQPVSATQKAVNAVKTALKDDKGVALPKNNRNLAEVIRGILADATKQELIEVAATVQTMLAQAEKAEQAAAEALAKASKPATQGKDKLAENQTRSGNGATVTRTKVTKAGVIPDTAGAPSAADKLIGDMGRNMAPSRKTRTKA